jgi:acetolactate synthase-1/2/3 large subunit
LLTWSFTLGRKLDFQLAYGSPAIFGDAKFVRIADCASELRDNRRGEAEVFGTVSRALEKILELAGNRKSNVDTAGQPKLAPNTRPEQKSSCVLCTTAIRNLNQ